MKAMTAGRPGTIFMGLAAGLGLLVFPPMAEAQLRFITNSDSTLTVSSYQGSQDLVIPEETNGCLVTGIATTATTCGGFTNVFLPKSLTNIVCTTYFFNGGPFAKCPQLKAINIDPGNPEWSSVDGVWFDKTQTMLIQYPQARTGYTIPSTVTNIGQYAFMWCEQLTNVVIPNSVTVISSNAFQISCITNIVIPDSVTVIQDSAFYQCYSLHYIALPDSVTNLGPSVFQDCHSLTNARLPSGITQLPQSLFYDAGLITLTVPAGVTNLGAYAFNCLYLQTLFFKGNAPNGLLSQFAYNLTTPTIYYLPGTTNWGTTCKNRPEVLWNPQVQTTNGCFGLVSNQFGFNITGNTNIPVVLETCTSLSGGWTPAQSVVLTNGAYYFGDPAVSNTPVRFYRIQTPQPGL